ncbi:MAG: peroxidase [Paracoccus denitrificans]|nr:MAG: peroxidase [Paracoccus denitrificans]PZO86069.1 MAG: peroxidase [Paracoccus denitrificans]
MPLPQWDRVPIDVQSIDAPLSRFAIFLTLNVDRDDTALKSARKLIGGVEDAVKSVGFRDLDAKLSCVVGIGADLWDRLSPHKRPQQLTPFAEVKGDKHTAPSTPGDILLHIRANRQDMCFELERLLLDQAEAGLTVEDEVFGFRYFDARDLLGFVDGSANPVGQNLPNSSIVGSEDKDFQGGSYVTIQKYLHDLKAWKEFGIEKQEAVIGRTKLEDVELPDAGKDQQKAHKTLCTITDDDGTEHDILRDNMPFGSPAAGEFGTQFIGYSRNPDVTAKMIERMFIGDPPGLHDRILDVSTAVTGVSFFAPSSKVLNDLGSD